MKRRARQKKSASLALLGALLLAGCATSTIPPIPENVERISFSPEPPPFCGRCETTDFIVSAVGVLSSETGYWAGNYRNWRSHRRQTQVSPEQFQAFKNHLAPYKPERDVLASENQCKRYITDNDRVTVEWLASDERRIRVFDFGCLDDTNMNDTIRKAPEILLPETESTR